MLYLYHWMIYSDNIHLSLVHNYNCVISWILMNNFKSCNCIFRITILLHEWSQSRNFQRVLTMYVSPRCSSSLEQIWCSLSPNSVLRSRSTHPDIALKAAGINIRFSTTYYSSATSSEDSHMVSSDNVSQLIKDTSNLKLSVHWWKFTDDKIADHHLRRSEHSFVHGTS